MDPVNRGLDLEKELTCSICTEVLYQPLTLLDCLHTFCGACLKEWFNCQLTVSSSNPDPVPAGSTPYTCPSCRAPVRETKHNATVTTLLEMFMAANPDKSKTAEEKEDLREKYTPGEEVIPKVEQREKTSRERMVEDEDRRLMLEVIDLSLRQAGVGPTEGRSARRRRDNDRLHIAAPRPNRDNTRESRSAEGRERRRRTDGGSDGERRRRRDEPATPRPSLAPNEDRRQRRNREEGRRRHEETGHTAARQIEHQASLRSLISSSDVDSREMEEEILRQIQEEGLLDGIDLDNIDVSQEDQISERIAEAFRRRQRERSTTDPISSSDASPAPRSGQSEYRERSGTEGLPASSRHRIHSRSASATRQADEQSTTTPRTSSTRLEVQSGDESRRRRRTPSGGRSDTSPIPVPSPDATVAARSQTDLSSDRQRSSHTNFSRSHIPSETRSTAEPASQWTAEAPAELPSTGDSQQLPSLHTRARVTARTEATAPPHELPTTANRSAPPTPVFVPASVPSVESQPSPPRSIVSAPLADHHHSPGSVSDSAALIQSAASPPSLGSRVNLPRFPEPSLSCDQCATPHIEYELHYNCSTCHNGDWNICLSCYRSGRGCLHWFGFGDAAWAKWEKLISSGEFPVNAERPHMLTANRYLPTKVTPGGADGRRTITSVDPRKRLQSGAFCANCLAWANECYWRCDICNEGDWGFCNDCVNQGKCCTHPLLPLLYKPDQTHTPPLSPTHGQQTPSSATLLTGPGVVEFGSFKPLTFRVSCDICRYPIQPSSTRYHCFSCTNSIPGRQPGDYDICTKCYLGLESKKRISPENGHNGWRRCLQGHRTIIVGFEDSRGGQRRIIVQDLVGGRCLHEEPSKSLDHSGQNLQQWSWADESQVRLVTTDVAATAPATSMNLSLTTKFPPVGGTGMRARALWSWYPKEGVGNDELLVPKWAEVRECVDVNGDWFFGVYMGAKGLFPAPYVRILDKGLGS